MNNNTLATEKEAKLRGKFKELLIKLAKPTDLSDKTKRDKAYKELEGIYLKDGEKEFRHFYSDIFEILLEVSEGPVSSATEYLGLSVKDLYDNYDDYINSRKKTNINIKSNLSKLYDHVSLELARLSLTGNLKRDVTSDKSMKRVNSRITELQTTTDKISNELDEKLIKNNERIEKIGREHVAILGIFAAIVITFTGGISFTTSVLNNIHQASIYRTIFMTLLIGFVLFNILHVLFLFINKIVSNNYNIKENVIFSLIINGVIVSIILATFFTWCSGTVEKRNKEFNKQTVIESLSDNTTKRKTDDNNAIIQIIQQ